MKCFLQVISLTFTSLFSFLATGKEKVSLVPCYCVHEGMDRLLWWLTRVLLKTGVADGRNGFKGKREKDKAQFVNAQKITAIFFPHL